MKCQKPKSHKQKAVLITEQYFNGSKNLLEEKTMKQWSTWMWWSEWILKTTAYTVSGFLTNTCIPKSTKVMAHFMGILSSETGENLKAPVIWINETFVFTCWFLVLSFLNVWFMFLRIIQLGLYEP